MKSCKSSSFIISGISWISWIAWIPGFLISGICKFSGIPHGPAAIPEILKIPKIQKMLKIYEIP